MLPIAARHSVSIMVVHHLRKTPGADAEDEISASTGLTGGVDGWLILRRVPGARGPSLVVDGRDIEEPCELAMRWNTDAATWSIEGDAAEVNLSHERREIFDTLRRSPVPMTPKEVADLIGGKPTSVRKLMWTMTLDEQLINNNGRYNTPVTAVTGVTTRLKHSVDYQNPLEQGDSEDRVTAVTTVTTDETAGDEHGQTILGILERNFTGGRAHPDGLERRCIDHGMTRAQFKQGLAYLDNTGGIGYHMADNHADSYYYLKRGGQD